MKKYFTILMFLILILFGCNQREVNGKEIIKPKDSLSVYFSKANNFDLPSLQRQEYNEKALKIVAKQSNDSLHRVNLFKVANRYYNLDNWEEYKKTVFLVIQKSKTAKDTFSLAKGYTYLGDYFKNKEVSDSAFMYYYKAEKEYAQLKDNYNVAMSLINKATLQYNESDFLGSEKAIFKALKVIKGTKSSEIQYDSYNLIGLIYNELDDFDNAMIYHNKALSSIDDEIPSVFQTRATSYNNIGYVYQNKNDYKLAEYYFQKGLEQKNVFRDKAPLYATLLNNLAYAKLMQNDTKDLPNLFFKSLSIRDSLNLSSGIISSKLHLSKYYTSTNNISKAIKYAKEALELSQSSKNYRNTLVALKQLSVIDPKKASYYSKEYIHINEKIQKYERKMGNKFTRIEYETDEIKDENTNLEVQNRNLLYFFGSFVIFGLFVYIISTQKNKNRELMFRQQQQQTNEEIYNLMISQQNTIEANRIIEKKRVAQELHDGVLGRIFGVRINLDSLNKINDEKANLLRNNCLSELKNIEQDIREISHDLSREKSELINNFVAIVDNLLEEQKNTFKTNLIYIIDSSIKWELIINSVKINLYRIIQESLQNCNKHAKANTIKIELKKEEGNILLTISDDGLGFNSKVKNKGIGLQNMLTRTNECKGTFDIKSKKGEGTIITVAVPIE